MFCEYILVFECGLCVRGLLGCSNLMVCVCTCTYCLATTWARGSAFSSASSCSAFRICCLTFEDSESFHLKWFSFSVAHWLHPTALAVVNPAETDNRLCVCLLSGPAINHMFTHPLTLRMRWAEVGRSQQSKRDQKWWLWTSEEVVLAIYLGFFTHIHQCTAFEFGF